MLVTHKPSLISGIDHFYGPPRGTKWPKGLPVWNPQNPDQAMVYWHLIKNRFGNPNVIIPMLDEFEYSRLAEYKENDSG